MSWYLWCTWNTGWYTNALTVADCIFHTQTQKFSGSICFSRTLLSPIKGWSLLPLPLDFMTALMNAVLQKWRGLFYDCLDEHNATEVKLLASKAMSYGSACYSVSVCLSLYMNNYTHTHTLGASPWSYHSVEITLRDDIGTERNSQGASAIGVVPDQVPLGEQRRLWDDLSHSCLTATVTEKTLSQICPVKLDLNF